MTMDLMVMVVTVAPSFDGGIDGVVACCCFYGDYYY